MKIYSPLADTSMSISIILPLLFPSLFSSHPSPPSPSSSSPSSSATLFRFGELDAGSWVGVPGRLVVDTCCARATAAVGGDLSAVRTRFADGSSPFSPALLLFAAFFLPKFNASYCSGAGADAFCNATVGWRLIGAAYGEVLDGCKSAKQRLITITLNNNYI